MLLFTRLFMCCIYSKKQTLRPFFMDRIQLSLQFSVNPGTHLVILAGCKAGSTLEPTIGFEPEISRLEI